MNVINMNKKILVIAPHPDDETLGVGATLLKHHKNGDNLFWLIMTSVTDDPNFTEEFRTERAQEIKEVVSLRPGNLVFLTQGKHSGEIGTLKEIKEGLAICEMEGQTVETSPSHLFVIGEKKEKITLSG